MLVVALRMQPEVRRAIRVGRESVEPDEAVELRACDLGLARLDRVQNRERLEGVARRGPGGCALSCLRERRTVALISAGGTKVVPQADVLSFLGGVLRPRQLGCG